MVFKTNCNMFSKYSLAFSLGFNLKGRGGDVFVEEVNIPKTLPHINQYVYKSTKLMHFPNAVTIN